MTKSYHSFPFTWRSRSILQQILRGSIAIKQINCYTVYMFWSCCKVHDSFNYGCLFRIHFSTFSLLFHFDFFLFSLFSSFYSSQFSALPFLYSTLFVSLDYSFMFCFLPRPRRRFLPRSLGLFSYLHRYTQKTKSSCKYFTAS